MSRSMPFVLPLVVLTLVAGCVQQTDPSTSAVEQPVPIPAAGVRFQAACVSVWDREIDGDWKGLVMFTDTSQVLVDTLPPGLHIVSVTRWMPAPVTVYEDSIQVVKETAIPLSCS